MGRSWCRVRAMTLPRNNLPVVLAVAVLLAASLVWAAPVPIGGPGVEIPGVSAEESARIAKGAVDLAKAVLANEGERYGYRVGDAAPPHVMQCMLYFGVMGEVEKAISLAKPGSYAANGLAKAQKWAQRGIDDWCGPRGGLMNHGLAMMVDASRSTSSGTHSNKSTLEGLSLTTQQREVLTSALKWAAVGAAALLALPNLALP